MSDLNVGELYDHYVKAFQSGDVDPEPFISQVQGEDRAELETMIENFLVTSPPSEWDEAGYEESISFRMAPEVTASLSGPSGDLPEVLKSLRVRLKIKVSVVERELAERLGAKDRDEEEQVGRYYHQLEFGTLPARPVSDQVFAALAGIFSTSAFRLRAAGEALGPQSDHRGGPVYARVADASSQKKEAEPDIKGVGEHKRTRIDDLFLGGLG